jgi:uncharacterized protein YqeY
MGIVERLDGDLKAAMKARDELRVQVIRMLKSDLRYKQIEIGRELTEDDCIGVLSTAAKRRKESVQEYRQAGREDLAGNESSELEILRVYLPEQLSESELVRLVDKAISESEAKTIKDIGAVMKILMPEVRGRADGKAVNAAVRARLEGK